VLNIADFVGPALSVLPPVAISLLADDPTAAVIAAATIVVAQLVDNFYLVPFMISSKVSLNPLLTILLVLIGAKVLGIVGIILAIPIYLVYKIVLRGAYYELVETYDRPSSVMS
jgi:predicted PurR-regulated permease PerM